MITAEQLKDIKERTEALNRYLDIEGKKIQVKKSSSAPRLPVSGTTEGCRGSDEESERLAAMDFRLQ